MCILESIAYGSAIHILRQDATVRRIVVIGYKFTLIPIVSMLQLINSGLYPVNWKHLVEQQEKKTIYPLAMLERITHAVILQLNQKTIS